MSTTHRHHSTDRAWRLVFAKMRHDRLAEDVLVHDIDDCAVCYYVIADQLAGVICDELTAQLHEGRFASRGLTKDHVLGWLAHQIAEALDRDDGAAA